MLIKRLSVLAVATSLVACASTTAQKAETVTPVPVTRVVEIAPQVIPVHAYAMPARQARVVPHHYSFDYKMTHLHKCYHIEIQDVLQQIYH